MEYFEKGFLECIKSLSIFDGFIVSSIFYWIVVFFKMVQVKINFKNPLTYKRKLDIISLVTLDWAVAKR